MTPPAAAAPTRQPVVANRSPALVTTTGAGRGLPGRLLRRRRRPAPRRRAAGRAGRRHRTRCDVTWGRTGSPPVATCAGRSASARGRARPRSCRSSRRACSARSAAAGSMTTTALSASPSAASTAVSHPSSMRTRSSSVPSTPSRPLSRSAPRGVHCVERQLQGLGASPPRPLPAPSPPGEQRRTARARLGSRQPLLGPADVLDRAVSPRARRRCSRAAADRSGARHRGPSAPRAVAALAARVSSVSARSARPRSAARREPQPHHHRRR